MNRIEQVIGELQGLEAEQGPRYVPCRECGQRTRLTPLAMALVLAAGKALRDPLPQDRVVACGPCAGLHRSLWTQEERTREALGHGGGAR